MNFRLTHVFFTFLVGLTMVHAQTALEQEFEASAEDHMRNELGVNDITTPLISGILKEFSAFQPIPLNLIAESPLNAVYDNRMQTALFFGSLVADGFMLTVAERPKDLQNIGRALIKQARGLAVNERITKRSKSLLEYADKGDWQGLREELIRTQADVEQTMLDLRDEEMAHMISLGGWLRGFQLAARSTVEKYSPDKARILGRPDIIDYYLDRLDTLHPRLKKTQFVQDLTANLKELSLLTSGTTDGLPTKEEVAKMSAIADKTEAIAVAPVDHEGNILPTATP